MRISEVSRRSGVSATALRYYESRGLIASVREANGYRTYDHTVLDRLKLIETAKHLDLSLAEVADLLGVVEDDTCTAVREALRPMLEQRLEQVEAHLASLETLRVRLVGATEQVAACPDSGRSCASECMALAGQAGPCLDPPTSASAWAGRGRPVRP